MNNISKLDGKVSIIIPAYNVGKYLNACLNSICAQTYQNYEIIVAYDEKSSDNTLEILKSFSENHLITIDVGIDKGSGDARNRGFRLSTGEFVVFVDGDDEITPDYLSSMMEVFHQHPEFNVVLCNYIRVNEEEVELGKKTAAISLNKITCYTREEMLYKKLWHEVSSAPWSYLVRRSFLLDNQITFPPYSHADDSFYTYKLVDKQEYVGYCSKILYIFIQHETSITHVLPDYWWRKYEPYVKDMIEYFSEHDPKFASDFKKNMCRVAAYMSARRLSYNDFISEIERYGIKKLNKLSRNDRLSVILSVAIFNLSRRLYYLLVKNTDIVMAKIWPLTQR